MSTGSFYIGHAAPYAVADEYLHTRGKAVPRKKVGNNTYLERRTDQHGVRWIDLVLHRTAVVTYSEDGLVRLDTGGWLTVTTKDRINSGLPAGWVVRSTKGVWELADGWHGARNVYRFTDGISLRRGHQGWGVLEHTALPISQREKDDAHNTATQRLISRYLKAYTGEHGGSCPLCMVIDTETMPSGRDRYISVGDRMGDTQHLVDHMLDNTYPEALLLTALSERGYIPENVLGHRDITKRALRAYLGSRLFRGAKAGTYGKKPVAA